MTLVWLLKLAAVQTKKANMDNNLSKGVAFIGYFNLLSVIL